MEIPTVKSCGFFSLSTFGLMIGFLQMVIHALAFLIAIRFGLFFLAPITIMALAVNVAWIYGIQEKKVIFMLPAFVPFVVISTLGIIFVSIFPIVVPFYIFVGDTIFGGLGTLFVWFFGSLLSVLAVYITIVEYSLCKSLEEMRRHESTRLPFSASCPPQSCNAH